MPPKSPWILESVVFVESLAAYVTAAVIANDDVIDSMASNMRHIQGLYIRE